MQRTILMRFMRPQYAALVWAALGGCAVYIGLLSIQFSPPIYGKAHAPFMGVVCFIIAPIFFVWAYQYLKSHE